MKKVILTSLVCLLALALLTSTFAATFTMIAKQYTGNQDPIDGISCEYMLNDNQVWIEGSETDGSGESDFTYTPGSTSEVWESHLYDHYEWWQPSDPADGYLKTSVSSTIHPHYFVSNGFE